MGEKIWSAALAAQAARTSSLQKPLKPALSGSRSRAPFAAAIAAAGAGPPQQAPSPPGLGLAYQTPIETQTSYSGAEDAFSVPPPLRRPPSPFAETFLRWDPEGVERCAVSVCLR